MSTIGYVVASRTDYLTVSSTLADDKAFIDPLSVPWGAITTVTPVTVGKTEHRVVKKVGKP